MKPLRLWSAFWGDKHIELFDRALVRSLSWPINRDALQGARWDIWTREKDYKVVVDIAKSVGIGIELHSADDYLARLQKDYFNDYGVMMNQMFLHSAKRCIESSSRMLIAPPDTIFGGDAVPNILEAGHQPGTVVFVVHIRVVPGILNELPEHSLSNSKLVSLALKYPHKSWSEAEYGKERINTHIGGIFWKKRPSGTYSVQHMLPTPYLINWTLQDYDFFNRQNPPGKWPPVFGEIDHAWPGECVHPNERARIIGSSDDAFIVEVTDDGSNVPPLEHYDATDPDKFWRKSLHNKVNRQFVVTFRGD